MTFDISNGVKVSGAIRPMGLSDSYPTHLDIFGKGGVHSVASEVIRDGIANDRRSLGMFAFDQDLGQMYSLLGGTTNANWVKLFEFNDSKIDFNLTCEENYIFVGDKDQVARPSPTLIDVKFDIIELRRNLDDLGVLEKLDHNRIWIGDYTNEPVAKTHVSLQHLPQINAAIFPDPTGVLSLFPDVPIPNPTFSILSTDWLFDGPWLPQVYTSNPSTLSPLQKNDAIVSSSLAMTSIQTAQVIKRLDNASFVVKNRTLSFTWENELMAAIPLVVRQFYGLDPSYTFTEAQALDEMGEGLVYNDVNGNLSKAELTNNYIWLGQIVGQDENVPVAVEHLLIDNLPNLGQTIIPDDVGGLVGKVWLGNAQGRPEESDLVGDMFADIEVINAKFETGKFIMNSGIRAAYLNAQFLNELPGGILKNTVTTGVLTIATGGKIVGTNDYVRPIDLQEEIAEANAFATEESAAALIAANAYFNLQMLPFSVAPLITAGAAITTALGLLEAQIAALGGDIILTLTGEAYGSGNVDAPIETKVGFKFFTRLNLPTEPHLGMLLLVKN